MIEVYFIGGPLDLTKRAYPNLPVDGRIKVIVNQEPNWPVLEDEAAHAPDYMRITEETYYVHRRIARNLDSNADVFVAVYNHPQYSF